MREENQLKYELAVKKLDTVDEDVRANLKKMAIHVMDQCDEKRLHEAFILIQDESFNSTIENIDEKISMVLAEEMLETWKFNKIKAEIDFALDKEA